MRCGGTRSERSSGTLVVSLHSMYEPGSFHARFIVDPTLLSIPVLENFRKKSWVSRPVTLAISRCGKTSGESCELGTIYRVKRMGLVRIMSDKLTLTSGYSVCWRVESNHYMISRKIIVVWSISLRIPCESWLMVEVNVDANLYQTYAAHQTTGSETRE